MIHRDEAYWRFRCRGVWITWLRKPEQFVPVTPGRQPQRLTVWARRRRLWPRPMLFGRNS